MAKQHERYNVQLHNTAWGILETSAVNAAWVEARKMGLTVEQCDRVAVAALAKTRELIELWAQQQTISPASSEESNA